MANITVGAMVEAFLRVNGYDGLVGEDGCGCRVNDLFPCCEDPTDCMAAYEWPCTPDDCPNPDCGALSEGAVTCLRLEKPGKDGAK